MYVDKLLEFGNAVTIAGTSGTFYPLVGSIDKGAALNELGVGEQLYIVFQIDTAVTSAAAGSSVTFSVVDDADVALGSPAVLAASAAIAEATLVAGYPVVIPFPWNSTQRYLGVGYTPSGEDTTGGTFSAFITKDPAAMKNYPSGFSVL